MSRKQMLVGLVIVLLAAVGTLVTTDETDAFPLRFPFYDCMHNGMFYTQVPEGLGGTVPACPDTDEAFLSIKDSHDGYNCAPPNTCLKTRHIDCEYTVQPGGL